MKLYLSSTFFLSILLINGLSFISGNNENANQLGHNFSTFTNQGSTVIGQTCLMDMTSCELLGSVVFSHGGSGGASCGSVIETPFAWLKSVMGLGCGFVSISNDSSFLISEGTNYGALVLWNVTLEYMGTWPQSYAEEKYVNCYPVTGCK